MRSATNALMLCIIVNIVDISKFQDCLCLRDICKEIITMRTLFNIFEILINTVHGKKKAFVYKYFVKDIA